MPRMGALAGTVADVMEPIDQVLTIIPVMLRCEVATSHYILLFWYMLVYSFSNQKRTWSSEELEAGNDEVFVSIFFGYVFEFPGLEDQLLCLKMGKGPIIRMCARSKTEPWHGGRRVVGKVRRTHLHLTVSYNATVIRVVFTLRTCLNKDWICSMCSMWPSEHVCSFRLRSPKHVAAGAEAPSGLHHEGFAEGLGKPAGVCGAPGAPS